MKRIALLILTNLAVLLLVALIAELTGLDAWLAHQGSGLAGLVAFAALVGFSGAFASLALSKWLAQRALGIRLIVTPASPSERWLLDTVERLARQTGLAPPEVGIFQSQQPNAFATGPRRNHALVAVSSGLLSTLDHDEITAVLGHEITHVANGDMVTLTLLQGVVNTFVILLSRIIGNIVDRSAASGSEERGPAYMLTVLVTQTVLGAVASLVVMGFSRQREFRADAGGARLAGSEPMIRALLRLAPATEASLPSPLKAFGIAGSEDSGWRRLFLSHPPIEERIAALRAAG